MARKREPPRSPRQKKTTSGASGPSAEQDHGYVKMRAQLVQLGLQLREIPGDGNCLFRALADQLTGCAGDHKIHRRETVDFIVQHRDEFEPFVEDDVPFDRHVASLVDEGTYAGNDSIVAFARNHGVTVVIHQLEAPLWQIPGDPDNVADAPQLHIAYHDGEHYNSVRRMGDLGQGPANVYINLEAPAQPSASCTSAEEREVMSRARCTDLTQVRRALNDCAGDVDAASEFLLALNTWEQDVTDAPPSPSSPHQLTKAAAAATAAKMRNDKNAGQVVSGRLERRQRRTEERDRRRRRKGAEPGDQLLSSSPPAAVGHLAALTI